jgi:hypothetical protein
VKTVSFFYAFLMWKYYSNNPCGRTVGDCSVRAISVALGLTWEEAFLKLATAAYGMCDMPSSNAVIWAVLRQNDFISYRLPDDRVGSFTVREFCDANPSGTFVLFTSGHVVTAVDGDYWDSWDSGNEAILYVWFRR